MTDWKPEKNITSPWDVDVWENNIGQPVKPSGDNLPYPLYDIVADWWDEVAEIKFQEWFNEIYGVYSHRCEWFYGDCEVEDEKTRKDLMIKWLHSAYLSGYNVGRCSND